MLKNNIANFGKGILIIFGYMLLGTLLHYLKPDTFDFDFVVMNSAFIVGLVSGVWALIKKKYPFAFGLILGPFIVLMFFAFFGELLGS